MRGDFTRFPVKSRQSVGNDCLPDGLCDTLPNPVKVRLTGYIVKGNNEIGSGKAIDETEAEIRNAEGEKPMHEFSLANGFPPYVYCHVL